LHPACTITVARISDKTMTGRRVITLQGS